MKKGKRTHILFSLVLAALLGALLLQFSPSAFASTSHYLDASSIAGDAAWKEWCDQWDAMASDLTKVSVAPGKDQTELNFAWLSKAEGEATPVVHFGKKDGEMKAFTGETGEVDDSLTDGAKYVYNHVTVNGLEENTAYVYTVEKNGEETEPVEFSTKSFSEVKMLLVGDPQIGASKGQPQGDANLVNDGGVANTAARNDAFGWDRTLQKALEQTPDLNFIISAGDQVNKTGKAKEEEFAGYLGAKVLASTPMAACIGNHDSLNPDFKYHFNVPNATDKGMTQAGGDYYYSYGPGLFIVLNINNYNVAEHKEAIEEAVASYPDAAWRVVTIHQDIYGSGLDHSDSDGMILRTQLTPVFDEFKIDVVLQGHDHTYTRSHLLSGDQKTHGHYEFRLKDDGSGYDWDHAFNVDTNAMIPFAPEEGDADGKKLHDDFMVDNSCYTLSKVEGEKVTDGEGILYITANSASGSKYYELIESQQDYIAARSQNWLPSYSLMNMTDKTFSIVTYQITDDGKVEEIDSVFTLEKSAEAKKAA